MFVSFLARLMKASPIRDSVSDGSNPCDFEKSLVASFHWPISAYASAHHVEWPLVPPECVVAWSQRNRLRIVGDRLAPAAEKPVRPSPAKIKHPVRRG